MTCATRTTDLAKFDRFCNGFVYTFCYEGTLPEMLISLCVLHVSELQEGSSQDAYKYNAFPMILHAFSQKGIHSA